MDIVSLGPLSTTSLLWRRARGNWAQTIICKATFDLLPGESVLANDQEPPNEIDHYWNDDPARSLYAPSDLVPLKPRADVLLVGKAFAPRDEPARCIVARLVVGAVDKSIEVYCDRAWTADGELHEGPRFSSMPLLHERAGGGAETWNPVGVSPSAHPDARGMVRIANLQPQGFELKERSTPVPPVTFGPIAPSWPARARKLGPHADWVRTDWRKQPLPDELDTAWFNAAPVDQQLEVIRGDERIFLEHLHREHVRLKTALPGLRPCARVEAGGATREIPMVCDTLWIDTDRAIFTLTWRGIVALQQPEEVGRILIAVEERERPINWAEVGHQASGRGKSGLDLPEVMDVGGTQPLLPGLVKPAAEALPFRRQPEPSWPEMKAVPAFPTPPPPARVPVLNTPPEGPAPKLSVGEAAVRAKEKAALAALRGEVQAVAPEPAAPVPAPVPAQRGAKIGAWVPPGSASEPGMGALAGGVLAASNEAAGVSGRAVAGPQEAPGRAAVAVAAGGGEVIELLWFDAEQVGRIRKHAAWKKIIAEVKARPREQEVGDAEAREKRQEAKDHRDVLAVLRRGEAVGAAGLSEAMAGAMEDGTFAPPLVLVEGVLEFSFEEKETLKATMALVAPFTAGDKKLKELSDAVGELLKSPWLEKVSVGLEGYTVRLREAFGQAGRGLPARYLEGQTERLLLEQRHYQKRTVLGEEWIRGLLVLGGAGGGAGEAVPAYLPERLGKELPMFQRFRVRAVVEGRLQLDQFEAHPTALRVVALGRLITSPGRR